MAEDKTKENSADFAQGVSLDQLPDGGKLVGRFNGEDVLLVAWFFGGLFMFHCGLMGTTFEPASLNPFSKALSRLPVMAADPIGRGF